MLFFMLDSKPDSLTIGPTIKQNMRIHRRMHPKKNQIDQIQNGRLSAIIYFDICHLM